MIGYVPFQQDSTRIRIHVAEIYYNIGLVRQGPL